MNEIYFDAFLSKWVRWSLPSTKRDLTGRTVIVTGSNIGLGYEAAKAFYSMGPERLILAVRSVEKGEQAKKEIVESVTATEGKTKVEVWALDMAKFESVKTFSERVNDELERVDVFLANAGMATGRWNQTTDGWETSLQTNVISTFLLAALLVPILKKTASLPPPVASVQLKPHLVIVASDVHAVVGLPEQSAPNIFDALNTQESFSAQPRYPTTKLLDVMLTRALGKSDELKDGSVVVCSVNPGFCRSELMRNLPWGRRQMLYGAFARTTEEGARTFLWASLEDEIPLGSYTSSCAVSKPSAFVESPEGEEAEKQVWSELGEIVAKAAPETRPLWTNSHSRD